MANRPTFLFYRPKKYFCLDDFFRLPFNWQTSVTYIYYQILWLAIYQVGVSIYGISNCQFFGTCWYLAAFTADFEQTVKEMDNDFIKIAKSPTQTPQQRIRQKAFFNDLIKFHCDIRTLSVAPSS